MQVYVGGTPTDLSHRSIRKGMFGIHKNELPQNFLGCLKKVNTGFLLVNTDHLTFTQTSDWSKLINWTGYWLLIGPRRSRTGLWLVSWPPLPYPQCLGLVSWKFASLDERWQMITKLCQILLIPALIKLETTRPWLKDVKLKTLLQALILTH